MQPPGIHYSLTQIPRQYVNTFETVMQGSTPLSQTQKHNIPIHEAVLTSLSKERGKKDKKNQKRR